MQSKLRTAAPDLAGSESGDVEGIIARAKRQADAAVAAGRREYEEREAARRRVRDLPEALDAAVHWGADAKAGEETLDFVRCLERVVALLKAEGIDAVVEGPGAMRDAARFMVGCLAARQPGFEARIGKLLQSLCDDQSIPIEEFMHSRNPRSFDHLAGGDHVRYFRRGHGPDLDSLWRDLGALAGIVDPDGRFVRPQEIRLPALATVPMTPDEPTPNGPDDVGHRVRSRGVEGHPAAKYLPFDPNSPATPDRLAAVLLGGIEFCITATEIDRVMGASGTKPDQRVREAYRRLTDRFPDARPFLRMRTGSKRRAATPAVWLSKEPKPPRKSAQEGCAAPPVRARRTPRARARP